MKMNLGYFIFCCLRSDGFQSVFDSRTEDDVDALATERIVEVKYLERSWRELGRGNLLHLKIIHVLILLIIIIVRTFLRSPGHDRDCCVVTNILV